MQQINWNDLENYFSGIYYFIFHDEWPNKTLHNLVMQMQTVCTVC